MTPEQQADYDYAMSQLNPKLKIQIAPGAVPIVTERTDLPKTPIAEFSFGWDINMFMEGIGKSRESTQKARNAIDAMIYAMYGIPKVLPSS